MRVGKTRFCIVETMAMSKDGKPLVGLFYEPTELSGYKGVELSGYPYVILWNEKYLISKNCDGNDTIITSYDIINQDSVNMSTGEITGMCTFKTVADYMSYLRQIGLSESSMNQMDNHISLWKRIFK